MSRGRLVVRAWHIFSFRMIGGGGGLTWNEMGK